MIQSEIEFEQMDRQELIQLMDNFPNIQCENCGSLGNWLVFKIQLNDKDDIQSQFKVNIIKQNGEVSVSREGGHFSPLDIDFALMKIQDHLQTLLRHNYPEREKGSAFIMIDFLKSIPSTRVTIVDIDGISLNNVIEYIGALRDSESQ